MFTFYISEPYLEAVPTVLILLALVVRNPFIFHSTETNFLRISKTAMFWTTFSISIFSGSFGMAKFLKLGPCQIVPSQNLHCGFFLVFITMATTLVSKCCVLVFSLGIKESEVNYDYPITCLIWISSCILPQFTLVSRKTSPYSPTFMIFLFDK